MATAFRYQDMAPGLNVMPLMQHGSGSTLMRWAFETYSIRTGTLESKKFL